MMYLRVVVIVLFMVLVACKSENESQENKTAINVPRVTYVVPDGWVEEEPANAMRKAQFRLPGVKDAGDAKLTVFVFPGTGGSTDANITRWYRQFKQPDGSSSADKAKLNTININNLQVTIVSLEGTYLKSFAPMVGGETEEVPESALLAAIVKTNSAPWFFKAVGPEVTINYWRESFDQLVQSFVYK
jgi:hypothetical protein